MSKAEPKLTVQEAVQLLEEQYGVVVSESSRTKQIESVEVGAYSRIRRAFPVLHGQVGSSPEQYWVHVPTV